MKVTAAAIRRAMARRESRDLRIWGEYSHRTKQITHGRLRVATQGTALSSLAFRISGRYPRVLRGRQSDLTGLLPLCFPVCSEAFSGELTNEFCLLKTSGDDN